MTEETDVVIVDDQGNEHVFPAGFDPARAAAIVRQQAGAARQTTPPAVMAPGGKPGTMTEEAWAALTPAEKIRNGLQWAGKVISGMTGMNEGGRDAVENPKTALAMAAVPVVLQKAPAVIGATKEAAARGLGMSSTRASETLARVADAAKSGSVNVGVEGPGAQGLRMLELQDRGGSLPRVVTQFMRRITDPEGAPMSFAEGRDFYSNLSRLSANEFGRLNPVMQRQLGAMREALHTALTDAAGTVGMGEQYAGGIREYAKAAAAAKRWEQLQPAIKGALLKLAGAIGLGGAAKAAYDVTK